MPHVVVEYTRNFEQRGDAGILLDSLCDTLLEMEGRIFTPSTIRGRAVPLDIYRVTGDPRDCYVHITLKLGPQLDETIVKASREALFKTAKAYFSPLLREGHFGFSLEIVILGAGGTSKIDSFSGPVELDA
jgi:5-carboxymethyl-2-hydroxymuconate isomerase